MNQNIVKMTDHPFQAFQQLDLLLWKTSDTKETAGNWISQTEWLPIEVFAKTQFGSELAGNFAIFQTVQLDLVWDNTRTSYFSWAPSHQYRWHMPFRRFTTCINNFLVDHYLELFVDSLPKGKWNYRAMWIWKVAQNLPQFNVWTSPPYSLPLQLSRDVVRSLTVHI